MFNLLPLPFALSALEPYISARTLEFHYGKHHQAYLDNLNKLIAETDLAKLGLEEIIFQTQTNPEQAAIFNNAAQFFNHNFYWQSLKAQTMPSEKMLKLITDSFGSLDNFYAEFKATALAQFGSGWAWLIKEADTLKIVKTANAALPDLNSSRPLLVIDVWEHAYYLDYQNRRADYIEAILKNLLNWDFAQANLA